MKRLLLAILAFAGIAAALWLFAFRGDGRVSFSFGERAGDLVEDAKDLLETSKAVVEKTVSTPPPLRTSLSGRGEELTVQGVLDETNRHRAEAGLPPLALDETLNGAASLKVEDMFEGQYFEHVSPSGKGPADLVDEAGYAYIAVGENLALGTYDDDADLVQAWMDSPGHRENILATQFTEIGIAVAKGEFEGHMTWLAVQEFARPAADCPAPDANLSAQISSNKSKLEATKQDADRRLREIEATPEPKTKKEADAYNAKVAKYNDLVKLINGLIAMIQGQVTVYNGQVQEFNSCVKG